MTKHTAIILAGGVRDGVCQDDPDALNKAFVSVGGSPLITRVLRALREAKNVGHIIVVAPETAPAGPLMLADERRTAGRLIGDSLRNGFADMEGDNPVLVVASDLPLISPSAVDEFIASAHLIQADLCYGYLERVVHESRFPTIRHTWARLKDGVYCGTGVFVIRPRAIIAVLNVLERVAACRKSPWRLASLLGTSFLLRYLLGILQVSEVEERASALLGRSARGILTLHPELAVNIDRYDDLLRLEYLLRPTVHESPTP